MIYLYFESPDLAPTMATRFATGWDLRARERVVLHGGAVVVVPTGVSLRVDPLRGPLDIQVRGRSGLAAKGILAHVGTIDSDYRGEIGVVLFGLAGFTFERGDRVGQLILPEAMVTLVHGKAPIDTVRGEAGYGSTGR